MNINGFVLAGGMSRRMGQDKALMRLGEIPLVLQAARILQPFVDNVTLLAHPQRYEHLWASVVADRWPNEGPLGAVCTGMHHSTAPWNVFLACDIPLVSRQFIELLIHRLGTTSSDAVVPRGRDGWQPLSAAYHARCREIFVRAFETGERSIVGLLNEVRVDTITQDDMRAAGLSQTELTNMNTPGDWEQVKALSRKDPKGY